MNKLTSQKFLNNTKQAIELWAHTIPTFSFTLRETVDGADNGLPVNHIDV